MKQQIEESKKTPVSGCIEILKSDLENAVELAELKKQNYNICPYANQGCHKAQEDKNFFWETCVGNYNNCDILKDKIEDYLQSVSDEIKEFTHSFKSSCNEIRNKIEDNLGSNQ